MLFYIKLLQQIIGRQERESVW